MGIHNTAFVHSGAEIGANVKIGPFSIIENDVVIEDGCSIGSNVLIASGSRIGENCNIFHGAVLGTVPQDLKFGGEKTYLEVGNNTTVREYATLNRGTTDHWKTVVGSDCLIMAYAHVAHDCTIGNNVIIANAVNMAGHVTIQNNVGIGGMTAIHQFVHIGEYCFIGGGYRVSKDVPPYILAMGEPLKFGGLNSVGLKRKGFTEDQLSAIKNAYKIIYRQNLNLQDAVKKLKEISKSNAEVQNIVEFVENADRGIIR